MNLTFPIALVKQVDKKIELLGEAFGPEIARQFIKYEDRCDFNLTFNSNRNWYFGNGTIDPLQSDFKLVAAKHLTQGLGFVSNLMMIIDEELEFVVPKLYVDDKLPNTLRMALMSPMDSLSSSRVVNRKIMAKELLYSFFDKQVPESDLPYEGFSTTFKTFEETGLYSKNLTNYEMTELERIMYHTAGFRLFGDDINPVVMLNGNGIMRLSNSYSGEFDSEYWNDDDYLMTPQSSLITGVTLAEKMNRHRVLYGRGAMSILKYVGYATRTKPMYIRFDK